MATLRECLGPLVSYFPHTAFTTVQERVMPTLLQCDANVVVAAPTGSGKTALLEAAMLRLFRDRLLPLSTDTGSTGCRSANAVEGRKTVYICPIKALASEKYALWREKFPALSVALETGDQELARSHASGVPDVPNADIIITTPERWDSITRRWKEGVVWSLVASVALLLLDEVHTVSEERGAALEAVVSRMKAIKASMSSRGPRSYTTRFVAISGTLPNIEDFAEWLQVAPSGVFSFTSADRPVPLTLRVVSYPSTANNPYAFDRFLSYKLFGLIRQFSEGRATIVFCASRSEAVNSALRIVEGVKEAAAREGAEDRLSPTAEVSKLAATANEKQLRSLLSLGIAYHHAAMSMNDRFLVERMFKEHYVSVICTTTTLALGVNLPAHLVIIKGTTFFKSGRREDLPLSEVAQMSGRAGRPGLDTHGVALVLTTEDKAALYEPLRHGDSCTTVESRLHQKMVEHVNAEVALRTIHSFALGVEWIKTTFLWIRLRRCPRHYGILFSTKEEESDFDREEFAAHLMRRMLVELEKQGCITIHQDGAHVGDGRDLDSGAAVDMKKGNYVVESTRVGRAMARRYVLLKTVELFNAETARVRSQKDIVAVTAQEGAAVPPKEGKTLEEMAGSANPFTLQQLLCILSRSTEFEDLHLRLGDRKHLNEINKIVRLPLKSGMRGGREVREDWHKVYVLIQAHLEHTQINDFSLRNDSVRLWSTVPRLARFLVDYAGSLDSYSFMKESSLLQRCIEQRMWWDGPVLKQLDGVGENAAKALMRCGIRSLADVAKTDPRKLESLCSRNPPFGNDLQDRCLALPQWALRLERCESSEMLRAVVTQTTGMDKLRASQTKYNMVLVVGNTATDSILLFRQFGSLEAKEKPLVFTFQISRTRRCRVVGCVFTEHQLLGTDANATLAVGEDGEKAEDDVNFTLAVDEDREKTEEAAHMRVEPLKKERKSVGPNTSTSAFDALTRDLRWVAGTSLRRAADAPNSLLLKNHGHFQRETQPTVDVLGDEFTTDNLEHERSSSKEAGAMVGGSSPDAATLVHSCGVDNTMTQMDEDYMQLVNRTADIASSLRLGRNSPAYSCKRSRENVSNDSSASRLRLMSEYANRQEGFAPASNTGKTVMLRKAVSPDPPVAPRSTATTAAAAAAAITTNHPCPSTRFRFSVRGAAFQPVQHDQIQRNPLPPPLQQKPPIEAMNDHQFSAVGGNAAFLVPRGAFPGTCFQPPWRVTLPYDFPLPTCTYDISSRVCAQPPQLPTNFGIPVPHHGGAMEVHPAWHRGAFTAAQSSGLRAWCPPSAATEPGTHWAPAPVRHGYVALNESRAPSTAEQFHGTYPTAPTVSDHYAVSNSRSAGVVPRATTVRKGWW